MVVNYKDLAKKKFEDWEPLFKRHQVDADAVNLVKISNKLLDANDAEIPNSVFVVLNDVATFTWRVETALNSAIEQVAVTSESKRFDTAYVEDFIRVAFRAADKLLSLKGLFPLNPFTDQQTFRRGSVASRCFFHFEKGELIPDITPWDTGYFVIENDNRGITWTATKFIRSQGQILADYPDAKVPKDKDTELLYIIARDTSQIWADTELLKELPNKLGYVPVIYHKVPMGSMLQDKDTIQYQGESGLFLIRDLFPELQRIASIIQSLNLKVIDQALQIQVPDFNPASPPKTVDEVTAPGAVNELPPDSRYELMPLGQLQAQAELLHGMLEDRMHRGMSERFQNILQPKTATEIMQIAQEQGEIILPRLATRGIAKQGLAEMFIKQTIETCEKAKIQTVKLGNQDWEVSKLKGDYEIQFKYHFQDPRMDAARQSLAISQRGLIPDKDIRINTLQREDPDGDERQLAVEQARRLSPLVELDWTITKLLEDADEGNPYAEDQAMALAMQWIPAAKQAMQGLLTPNRPEEVKSPRPMMPVLNESQRGVEQNA